MEKPATVRWRDDDGKIRTTVSVPEMDAERLAAVLEGRNDPGYNPPDFPLIVDDDPADPDVKADH